MTASPAFFVSLGEAPYYRREKQHCCVTRATLPGTGDALWPILWRAQVALGRRNARKGVGSSELKVRANPPRNRASVSRSDRSKHRGALRSWHRYGGNAVMPLDVLGRTVCLLPIFFNPSEIIY